eukprot:8512640-Alexandrium_andersonii.AAC.1
MQCTAAPEPPKRAAGRGPHEPYRHSEKSFGPVATKEVHGPAHGTGVLAHMRTPIARAYTPCIMASSAR